MGKGNVAVAEVHLQNNIVFGVGGTSRGKSPTPKPNPKSEGGQFEPIIDSRTQRMMDTDAEYKVISAIADTLDESYSSDVAGTIYLYTELQPCQSCSHIVQQFQAKFPKLKVELFWDYPYP